jgi:hypothetical protein
LVLCPYPNAEFGDLEMEKYRTVGPSVPGTPFFQNTLATTKFPQLKKKDAKKLHILSYIQLA